MAKARPVRAKIDDTVFEYDVQSYVDDMGNRRRSYNTVSMTSYSMGVYSFVGGEYGRLQAELIRGNDRRLSEILDAVVSACRSLGLTARECEEAGYNARKIDKATRNDAKPLSRRLVAAAAVAKVLVDKGVPLSMVTERLGLSPVEARQIIDIVYRVFGNYMVNRRMAIVYAAAEAVKRVVSDAGEDVVALAQRIALTIASLPTMSSKSVSIGAAAAYVALKVTGHWISMGKVASAMGMSEATIRKVLKTARLTVMVDYACTGRSTVWVAGRGYRGAPNPIEECSLLGLECSVDAKRVEVRVEDGRVVVRVPVSCFY